MLFYIIKFLYIIAWLFEVKKVYRLAAKTKALAYASLHMLGVKHYI